MLLGSLEPSTGVHDELYARCLVLNDGLTQVAIVTFDLIGMSLALANAIRTSIRARTGVRHVLLCCSHTHSAPFTIPWSLVGTRDFERTGASWCWQLVENVVRLVSLGQDDLREATLSVGRAQVQVGDNRRLQTPNGVVMKPNPDGSIAPWADVLRVDDMTGRPIAVLFSHGAHPVVIHRASTLISADYPGYATASVRREFGDECVAMFAQSCGGNVNGPLMGGFDVAERVGGELGEAAILAARGSVRLAAEPLKVVSAAVSLPLEDMPDIEQCDIALESARADLASAERAESVNSDALWELRDRVLILEDLRARALSGETQELPFEVIALSIGRQWCLTAMTHEVFSDYQLWAEAASPFDRNMTVAYTNGVESYIPTDVDLGLGGYEASPFPRDGVFSTSALKYPRRLALRPGAEKLVKDAMIQAWGR